MKFSENTFNYKTHLLVTKGKGSPGGASGSDDSTLFSSG